MVAPSVWLQLKKETRHKIAAFLGMSKTGGVEVYDGMVACDGYTAEDLSMVTAELLQKELGLESTDFYELFRELVRRIELPPVEMKMPEPKKAFCDQCDSQGVRHKAVCPTLQVTE